MGTTFKAEDMKAVGIIALIALAFAGGVYANERWDIGSDPASRISSLVDSIDFPGGGAITSVDSAWVELRDLEMSHNKEWTQLNELTDEATGAFFMQYFGAESDYSRRIMRRVCESLRSLIKSEKRMVELMRYIEEEALSAAPVPVTLQATANRFLSGPDQQVTAQVTADELEGDIAEADQQMGLIC